MGRGEPAAAAKRPKGRYQNVWIVWERLGEGQPRPWAVEFRVVGGVCKPYLVTGTKVSWEPGLLLGHLFECPGLELNSAKY